MEHPTPREREREIPAAWFVVPMALAAAVLLGMAALGPKDEPAPPLPVELPVTPTAGAPVPASSEPLPEEHGHVQAF